MDNKEYKIVSMDNKKYAVKKAVIIRGVEMPRSCKGCEFIGYQAGCTPDTECLSESDIPELDLPLEVNSLPHNSQLPFCTIDLENISDHTVRAAHCRLKEVYALERVQPTKPTWKTKSIKNLFGKSSRRK